MDEQVRSSADTDEEAAISVNAVAVIGSSSEKSIRLNPIEVVHEALSPVNIVMGSMSQVSRKAETIATRTITEARSKNLDMDTQKFLRLKQLVKLTPVEEPPEAVEGKFDESGSLQYVRNSLNKLLRLERCVCAQVGALPRPLALRFSR
jgi:hypothetical protein